MRVAVITDLHGNLEAVETVLEAIDSENVDVLVCAGDVADPLRETRQVWELLRSRNIPVLRGNHEDYTVKFYSPEHHHQYLTPAFRPVKLVAESLGANIAEEFRNLPLSMRVSGPNGKDLFICHASPTSNQRTYYDGLDLALERELEQTQAAVIINGHRHTPWSMEWRNQLLVTVGSVGIPLAGKREAEYALFSFQNGSWNLEHRTVPYDAEKTLARYRASGWIAEGGPVAWLLYDELATAIKRVAPFMAEMRKKGGIPEDLEQLRSRAKSFLSSCSRWDDVQPYT